MQYLRRIPSSSSSFQLALVSFLPNFSMHLSLIFMPLYADDMGASKLQVGLIMSSYGMAVFVSAFLFGRLSDIHGRLVFIRYGLGLAVVAYLLQLVAPNPIILLLVRGFVGFSFGISAGATMAYVYEVGSRVGSFASYGALGALFGSLAAAAILDYEALFIASAAGAGLAMLISLLLREEPRDHISVPAFPVGIVWANRKIYLPFLLRHMGASAIWAIFPLFLMSIGANKGWIGILWAINVGGQFVAMQLVQRFSPARMFTIGLLLSLGVFIIYGIASHYLQLVPVQMVLAIAWSCLFVGALTFLLRRNVERGTAVGLLYSTNHLGGGLGPLLGGAVSHFWGFGAVMFCAAGLTFGGLLASLGSGASAGTRRE
jgi:MFS family permease